MDREKQTSEQIIGKPEKRKQHDYPQDIKNILDESITPDNANTYADTALDQIIKITGMATTDFKRRSSLVFNSEAKLEDAAFACFGMGNIGKLLDFISIRAEDTKTYDRVIANAIETGHIILPASKSGIEGLSDLGSKIGESGEHEEKPNANRLMTTLIVLHDDFHIDCDPAAGQISLSKGSTGRDPHSDKCYYMLAAPSLKRTILVCDTFGNATYVINSERMKKYGISNEELAQMSKAALMDIMSQDEDFGKRIIYSNSSNETFVENLIIAIDSTRANEESYGRYLIPQASEGFLPLTSMCNAFDIGSPDFVKKCIDELIEKDGQPLGPIEIRMFNKKKVPAYSPDQQAIIIEYIHEKLGDRMPEGYLTPLKIANTLNILIFNIEKAIGELGDTLGSVGKFNVGSHQVVAYSPEQQSIIRNHLEKMGYFEEKAPDGYKRAGDVLADFGYSATYTNLIKDVVLSLGDDFGKVKNYIFVNRPGVPGYSPEQQNMIVECLNSRKRLRKKIGGQALQ